MTDRDTLAALVARVEAATGPDRELDAEIACAMCRERLPTHCARPDPIAAGSVRDAAGLWQAPHYTASLDAAVALVPEGWGWGRLLDGLTYCAPLDENMSARAVTTAAIDPPALALTSAALRARMEARDER